MATVMAETGGLKMSKETVIVRSEAKKARAFAGGTQAFSVTLTLASGEVIKMPRCGNPGRTETPAQFVQRVFPIGEDVCNLSRGNGE